MPPQTFTISVTAPTGGQTIIGNNSSNILHGGSGNDTIDGLKSSDTMYGHGGNDTYYVDTSGDKVIEVVGEGYDRVFTASSFSLQTGSEVEYLKATGFILGLAQGQRVQQCSGRQRGIQHDHRQQWRRPSRRRPR